VLGQGPSGTASEGLGVIMYGVKASVLIVDGTTSFRRLLRKLLSEEGFFVIEAANQIAGKVAIFSRYPDLMILDPHLPDGDGIDLLGEIREHSDIPVLILTEFDAEDYKVRAFDTGADDYIVKPFSGRELIEFGGIRVDTAQRAVTRQGELLHLTPLEYGLLTQLIRHPYRVFSHKELLNAVWGSTHDHDTHYLRVYMGNLRKKIELDPIKPKHLRTEVNVGYRFVP
jgi:two-component system, OmpR family, KDP operon response regulator KdpE